MPAHVTENDHTPMTALLLVSDRACEEGDLGTLAHNAEMLACCLAEPLRLELLDLVHCCREDGERVASQWAVVREHLRARLAAVAIAMPC